jgi:hypothetical protein
MSSFGISQSTNSTTRERQPLLLTDHHDCAYEFAKNLGSRPFKTRSSSSKMPRLLRLTSRLIICSGNYFGVLLFCWTEKRPMKFDISNRRADGRFEIRSKSRALQSYIKLKSDVCHTIIKSNKIACLISAIAFLVRWRQATSGDYKKK